MGIKKEYDEKGRLTREVFTNFIGITNCVIEYNYDDKDRKTKRYMRDRKGKIVDHLVYEYDGDLLVREKFFLDGNEPCSVTEYGYTTDGILEKKKKFIRGKLSKETVYYENGNESLEIEYDNNGKVSREISYYESGGKSKDVRYYEERKLAFADDLPSFRDINKNENENNSEPSAEAAETAE